MLTIVDSALLGLFEPVLVLAVAVEVPDDVRVTPAKAQLSLAALSAF